MRKGVLAFGLMLLIVAVSRNEVLRSACGSPYTDVDVHTGYSMITNGSFPTLVILDVRTQSEYDGGHIRDCRLIPLTELASRLDELDPNDVILVYCGVGGRSATASQTLDQNGFLHVYNMLGGMTEWTASGYPVYVKYPSIQQAINNAGKGDTVRVSSGTYYEHVAIDKSMTLVGENLHTTVIDGAGNGTVFNVQADNVSVQEFTLRYCGCSCQGFSGIHIQSNHQNITITRNHLVSNGFGIRAEETQGIRISYNNITNNSDWSITISNSSVIQIFENNIADNLGGIQLQNCTSATISSSKISRSSTGILLSNSTEISMTNNTFSRNLLYGIYVSESSGNLVFHNNLIENRYQVYTYNSANHWDSGGEGNHWSNHNGTDMDTDAIWDTPYTIDENNTDHYPLAGMFSDFQATSEHRVQTISNSTVSDFQFDETAISFNVTGQDDTVGFCRTTVPAALMNGTYIVLVNGVEVDCNILPASNSTHIYLYFAYNHSTKEVIIVPELHIPTLWVWAVLLLALVSKESRKHSCYPN